MTQDTSERTLTLTQADLDRLLDQAAARAGGPAPLPPGAYRKGVAVFRDVLVPTGRSRRNKRTHQIEGINRKIARPVYVTSDMSPGGLVKAKRAAQQANMDFWHPEYGWLRHGCYREVDRPEEMGRAGERFEAVYEVTEQTDETLLPGGSVMLPGIPVDAEAGTIEHDDDDDDGEGEAPAPAAEARRGPGRPRKEV